MNKEEKELTARTLKQLNQMAVEAVRGENYRQALEFFTQSLVIEEKLGLKAQVAESFFNLASTYFLMEEYEEALRKARFAEDGFRQAGREEDCAKAQAMIEEIRGRTAADPE